jgi:hypothetical protein
MKKQNNIPPLVLIVGILYGPLCFMGFSHFFNATRQLYEAPGWVDTARLINGVTALLYIVSVFIFERQLLHEFRLLQQNDQNILDYIGMKRVSFVYDSE